jgi:hypothetical protein
MAPIVEPVQSVETVEAVIISGPRKGEIVRLPEETIPDVSDEDIKVLNEALDGLIAAIDRVSAEVRLTTEAMRERVQEA